MTHNEDIYIEYTVDELIEKRNRLREELIAIRAARFEEEVISELRETQFLLGEPLEDE